MACLLILGLRLRRLPGRDVDRGAAHDHGVDRGPRVGRGVPAWSAIAGAGDLGETSFTGPVFIAWDAADDGARHPERGHNVVYHEFAHKLDMDDGTVDGTPVLAAAERRQRWIEVCTAVYEELQEGRAGAAARSLRRA